MPLYKANTRFGPWRAGDTFESIDPYHERLAESGHLTVLSDLNEFDDDESGLPPQLFNLPDVPTAGEPVQR